jgi:nicotinamide phosphoribosyltransferase
MSTNPVTLIDGYKLDHRRQYPKNTVRVYSNFTARGTRRVPAVKDTTVFGPQYFLQKYLMEEFSRFFNSHLDNAIDRYKRRVTGYLGPQAAEAIGTDHVASLHGLGYLPLEFRVLPEGSRCPLRCPVLTVENTLDEFFWLPNYIETILSNVLWMPMTSATSAREIRKVLVEAAVKTGAPVEFVDWQGHDFSFRGMPGIEAAQLSGAGHLIFFTGTDTIPALDLIEDYYGDGLPHDYLIGGSVAATEHSVMCAGGEEGEGETFDRLLDLYPSGILSVVSDTWDLWKVLTEIVPNRKDHIMARDGKLVIRPDSGDPADILCGDEDAPAYGPAAKGVVELLWETFGGIYNSKGFKQLDPHVGCIYGDSITRDRAEEITGRLRARGFASSNVVFGVGSYTYQHVTRDTDKSAMKATWVKVGDEGRSIFKKPATDDGTKNSARGRLALLPDANGVLELVENATPEQEAKSALLLTWRNGSFVRRQNFADIRAVARAA